jgi:hypothetical protein
LVLVELEFLVTQQETMALIQYLMLLPLLVVAVVVMTLLVVWVELAVLEAVVVDGIHHLQEALVTHQALLQAKVIMVELEQLLAQLEAVVLEQ